MPAVPGPRPDQIQQLGADPGDLLSAGAADSSGPGRPSFEDPTGSGATGATGATGPAGPPGPPGTGGGGGGGGTAGFFTQESFLGDNITGVDATISTTLSEIPASDVDVLLFLNGVLQRQGFDYVMGTTDPQSILWLAGTGTAVDLTATDVLIAYYRIG